jgi:2-keto-4-pentenoate hydratase/2-oxohepta-3-ene-1,7-dioic acid hydratase in catechol pathway
VVQPSGSDELSYEGELAVVIKTITKGVKAENAAECIYGYTIANDVTARDWQRADGQWARAKGFDTSCPLGPWIETELDPADLAITTTLAGEVKQNGTTADMVHGVAAIIEYASAAFTLLPGDVILTGTPAGVGLVDAGKQVTVEIEGIGSLTNTFVRR